MMRLAVLTSHPVQYYAPLFRELASHLDLQVFYAHQATPEEQGQAGFGVAFDWDVDLTTGYAHHFLNNVSAKPGTGHFSGCDTPEIYERLMVGRFDVVLSLGWHLKSLLQGVWAAKRLGLPVMVRGDSLLDTPRGLAKRLVKAAAYPVLLRSFDAALYVGQKNRAYYEHYHYPAHRLFHAPHCIDTKYFTSRATPAARQEIRKMLGIGDGDTVLLFAGKLISSKRPLDVIEASTRIMRNGQQVSVMMAGSGELSDAAESLALRCGVPLYMMGFQNQSCMPAVYVAADMLVLPSRHETWGLVCNEALASGLPVVISDQAGCAPDLVGDAIAGRMFRMGDIASLSEAISSLVALPPSRNAITAKSGQFSLERTTAAITDAAAAVVSQRGKAG